jgi:hypothetical protein
MIDKSKITPQWLAGFFDGEGCVSIHKSRQHGFRISVVLTQSDRDLLILISSLFGGCIQKSTKSDLAKKTCYYVMWAGTSGRRLLEYIKADSILKSEQIEIALAFMDTIGSRGRDVPSSDLSKRVSLAAEIKKMKDNGNVEKERVQ